MEVNDGAGMTQLEDILDTLSTGVITLDTRLQVVYINAAAQVLLEASEARALGQDARALLVDGGELADTLAQVLEARTPLARRGMTLQLPTGAELHLDLFATLLVEDGEVNGMVLELQAVDRLQRISREESLLQAHETTRAVIRGLAHEIKNPLGGVRGAAQLLARELPNDELAEYTSIIIREADRLRDLVDRLLGPHHQLDLQSINIHETLEHVRNLISAESDRRVQITRDYDPSLPQLPGDRSQLIQAVLNIMRNALQAAESPDACHITLRTRSRRQFTIGTIRHRLVCSIEIIDNGPGIPESLQQSIFVPMVTGRADGSGLGLSIAQSIINRHGGLLECRSEPGDTRFTIYLPMESKHAK